jgi:predicted nucleic acid-binding protein
LPVVVSDTSPIIVLAHLRRLDFPERFFGIVLVPPAVVAELQKPAWKRLVPDALDVPCVQVRSPTDRVRVGQLSATLDLGEAEALALALEVRAEAVLMDEAEGRDMAQRLGLTCIGALGLLLRAKREGLLAAVRPELDCLQRDLGFHVSDRLRAQALTDAGE